MTETRAIYFENKYKLFIKVWQTSDSINEVHARLHAEHGWFNGMEEVNNHGYYRNANKLFISNVKAYARRLRQKGIELKDLLYRPPPPSFWGVNYALLGQYAQQIGSTDGH